MKELYSALIKAQSEMRTATKDAKNPHFRTNYADFNSVSEACRDALHRNGLTFVQPTRIHESGITVVVTRILHNSGQMIEGEYPIICKDMTNPQAHGGGLTYARRYALASMLGIVQEDDDGNTAAGHTPAQPVKPTASAIQQNVQRMASPTAELLATHGKSMADVEAVVGAKQQTWTETQKAKATAILQGLKAGKPWSEAIK